jgi:hypothetical protein
MGKPSGFWATAIAQESGSFLSQSRLFTLAETFPQTQQSVLLNIPAMLPAFS